MENQMKVLITRPQAQSASFAAVLAQAGFTPVFFPVIEIRHRQDNFELDEALANLWSYDWVIFTSVNGVETVFERGFPGKSARTWLYPKIAAIGPKTSAALQERGFNPDFVPGEFVAEAILPGLGNLVGSRVLLPRAEIARKALPEAIHRAGGRVHEIAVYHTLPATPNPAGIAALMAGVDWITFTSPSTVENFIAIVRQQGLDPLDLPGKPQIACIGPITAQAAGEAGYADTIIARQYTTEGLLEALRQAQPDRSTPC
jgi:uroporphyrinogen-III synthase